MAAYATPADLTGYLPAEAVEAIAEDAERILARASEVVADAVSAGYPVDAAGLPVHDWDRTALRDATCAQVEQWLEVGEENDIAGYSRAAAISVSGGLSLSSLPSILAPRARRILRSAGMTGGRAW